MLKKWPAILLISTLVWLPFKNVNGQVSFWRHTIDSYFGAYFISLFDMDKDGDLDIISGHSSLAWWENDGSGNFQKHSIDNAVSALWSIAPVDVDKDGKVDLLIADSGNHDIVWYRNTGSGFKRIVIESGFINAESVGGGDFDGDGDIDIAGLTVGTDTSPGIVAWWENRSFNFYRHDIDLSFDRGHKLLVTDLDRDGDLDILACAASSKGVTLFRNDGQGNFSSKVLYSGSGIAMYLTDYDKDGRTDILYTRHGTGQVVLLRNSGGTSFSANTLISGLNWPHFAVAADFNLDGKPDIAVVTRDGNTLECYENTGGSFQRHVLSNISGPFTVAAADMNGDGLDDIVSGSKNDMKLWWWENEQSLPKSITLNTPNGGERMLAGSTWLIKWSSSGNISNVAIRFSDDGGSSWSTVTSGTANDGNYTWRVPDRVSSQCLIEVSDANDASVSDRSDATFSISKATVSGKVEYFDDLHVIPGVEVDNLGTSQNPDATVDPSGNFSFDLGYGTFEFTFHKAAHADVNNALTFYDAALVARNVVGLSPLSALQKQVGDVTQDGHLTAYDAALIARYAIDLPIPEGYPGYWFFIPETLRVDVTDLSSQNFLVKGFIAGDVDGSWVLTVAKNAVPLSESAAVSDRLTWEQTADSLAVRLDFPATEKIFSFMLECEFPVTVGSVSVTPSGFEKGWSILTKKEKGRIKIGGFGTVPAPEGSRMSVVFRGVPEESSEKVRISRLFLNGRIVAGGITIESAEAESETGLPRSFKLYSNYPNPFHKKTHLKFYIPGPGDVVVRIYDVKGRFVAELQKESAGPGWYTLTWSATDFCGRRVPAGIYLLRWQVGSSILGTQKITYLGQ
jgi:hypothetical protein